MNDFEKTKKAKLQRLRMLRIMNALGMIRWDADRYGGAEQRLRMLHPLSWPWFIALIGVAVALHGVIEVWGELKIVWRDECVWW